MMLVSFVVPSPADLVQALATERMYAWETCRGHLQRVYRAELTGQATKLETCLKEVCSRLFRELL